MSLTTRKGTPVTWYCRLLVTIILFSLVVIPLCAAEGNETTAADTPAVDTPAADTPAANTLYTINPAALFISKNKGDSATITITIFKSTPETIIDDIAIVPLDLIRADGKRINSTEIEPGTQNPWLNGAQIPVTFYFNKSVSGAYSGMLAISSNTSTTLMPVSVNLKDGPFWPLVVLFVVTFLSVLFYDYATRGRKRDTIVYKMNDIKSRFKNEFPQDNTREYTKYFEDKITTRFEEAKRRIEQNDYDNAESMYAKAEEVWMHWILFRGEWSALIEQSITIKTDMEDIRNQVYKDLHNKWPEKEDFPLEKDIHKDLKMYWGSAADIETRPESTREALNTLEKRRKLFCSFYKKVREHIKKWEEKNPEIPRCLSEHRKLILSLNFAEGDQETIDFVTEMLKEDNQYTRCLKDNGLPTRQKMSNAEQRILDDYLAEKKADDKKVKPSKWRQLLINFWTWLNSKDFWIWLKSQGSRIRLWVFDKLNTIFLPAFVLWLIGYTMLYEKNPTFGANLSDYFLMIVWALGTGTASESLVTLIKSNNTPI